MGHFEVVASPATLKIYESGVQMDTKLAIKISHPKLKRTGPVIRGVCAAFLAVFVLGTVLQAFAPHWVGTILIAFRLAIIPLVVVGTIFSLTEVVAFGLLAVVFVTVEVALGTQFNQEVIEVLLSIFASLAFFRAGVVLAFKKDASLLWRELLIGLLAFNLLTLFIYGNAVIGGDLAQNAFEHVGRKGEDPFYRFALGNAIELPAVVTILTVAATTSLAHYRKWSAVTLLANLATAVISQSRFVVLIAAVPVLRLWKQLHVFGKLSVILLVGLVILWESREIRDTFTSLGARFSGKDYNSANGRLDILILLSEHSNWKCIVSGNGITSSRRLMEASDPHRLGYRSMESVLLESYYELGVCRMTLLALFLCYSFYKSKVRFQLRLELLLVTLQALVALPMMTFTPFFIFGAGALCVGPSELIDRRAQGITNRRRTLVVRSPSGVVHSHK